MTFLEGEIFLTKIKGFVKVVLLLLQEGKIGKRKILKKNPRPKLWSWRSRESIYDFLEGEIFLTKIKDFVKVGLLLGSSTAGPRH